MKLNHLTIHPDALRLAAVDLARQQADEIKRLRAELAALQEDLRYVAHSGMGSCAKVHAAPAGWQLVPVEPTSKKHCETCANEPLSASSTPCEVCCLAPFGQYPSWTPKGGE